MRSTHISVTNQHPLKYAQKKKKAPDSEYEYDLINSYANDARLDIDWSRRLSNPNKQIAIVDSTPVQRKRHLGYLGNTPSQKESRKESEKRACKNVYAGPMVQSILTTPKPDVFYERASQHNHSCRWPGIYQNLLSKRSQSWQL